MSSDQESHADPSAAVCWSTTTRSIAAGDTTALAIFYEFAFDIMYREAARISGRDEPTCLDIVHDAMLKAMRCMKRLDDAPSVASWSRAVAKSVTYDWLRNEARKQRLEQRRPAADPVEDSNASNETEQLKEFELRDVRLHWLEQELQQLPDELRGLISLRYRLGWSLQKIGQRVGLKTGAVDGRLRRAIEKLKQKAESQFDER